MCCSIRGTAGAVGRGWRHASAAEVPWGGGVVGSGGRSPYRRASGVPAPPAAAARPAHLLLAVVVDAHAPAAVAVPGEALRGREGGSQGRGGWGAHPRGLLPASGRPPWSARGPADLSSWERLPSPPGGQVVAGMPLSRAPVPAVGGRRRLGAAGGRGGAGAGLTGGGEAPLVSGAGQEGSPCPWRVLMAPRRGRSLPYTRAQGCARPAPPGPPPGGGAGPRRGESPPPLGGRALLSRCAR
jgi:hypothetical protein